MNYSDLFIKHVVSKGAQWLSGRVLDSRPRGCGFEPHQRHCIVSLSKNIYPSLVLVLPRKTCPFITERLLMGCKESNQTKDKKHVVSSYNMLMIRKQFSDLIWPFLPPYMGVIPNPKMAFIFPIHVL